MSSKFNSDFVVSVTLSYKIDADEPEHAKAIVEGKLNNCLNDSNLFDIEWDIV